MDARATTLSFVAAAIAVSLAAGAAAQLTGREMDPVILEGDVLTELGGVPPAEIVAFAHQGGWVQIPVQVDERFVNDYGLVYNLDPTGLTVLAYADPGTFMGADPDPDFDDDDELVFMAGDAGDRAPNPTPDPAGVLPGTRLEILVTDPLAANTAYVYLFRTDGSLSPAAGADYVDYSFDLLSGSYLGTYNTLAGPNPEDTAATTAHYRTHFSDRWIRDETNVYAGGASGDDVLDRHKNLFTPGVCTRSENTFSIGEGAFFANIDGPVRAIRSYMGANSGPFTQRDHIFYARRHDVVTYLRVHAIGGITDFYDYTPAATGMVYANDLNPAGVTIDGSPDVVTPGPIVWEMVAGTQGTLIHAHSIVTDIPGFAYTSYYEDDTTPSVTQCTGDAWAYGSSGIWITEDIPNTDPSLGAHNVLESTRVIYAEAPGGDATLAEQRYQQATTPLAATVNPQTAIADASPPAAVRLAQNRPNPFRSQTRIEFALPGVEDGTARLGIYDVAGRLVRTLNTGATAGSRGVVVWDGRDASGRRVAPGVYAYRLETASSTSTRKLVVVH